MKILGLPSAAVFDTRYFNFFCSCRYHVLFSFCFISYMGRFWFGLVWFGFVQPEIGIISYCLISLLFLLTFGVNLMDEGWNDVKYREITCILNLTKDRTKNRIDLPPNLGLIDVKIISVSNHASCYLYCCLGALAFTF